MIRTQVYIPDKLHKQLLLIAGHKKTTLSELIRKGAKKVIREEAGKDNSYSWLDSIIGMAKSNSKNTSKKIDYYLYVKPYEDKRRKK